MDAHALHWGASLPHCCRHLACASAWRCSEDMSWPSTSPVHTCFKACDVTAMSALKSHLSSRLRFNPSVKWSMFGACPQSRNESDTTISFFHNYRTNGNCIKVHSVGGTHHLHIPSTSLKVCLKKESENKVPYQILCLSQVAVSHCGQGKQH